VSSGAHVRVIGYIRVSTDEQAMSGLGLEAQERAIRHHVDGRDGWRIVQLIRDEAEWSGHLDRPGLMRAFSLLVAGRADALVVAKLDRLTRSSADFSQIMLWLREEEKQLVVLDFNVDTTTAAGEAMATVLMAFAQMERGLISERTRAALASLRARGQPIGRPAVVDDQALTTRILELRAEGKTLWGICEALEQEGYRTLRGGTKWRPSSLQAVLGQKRRPRRRKPPDLPTSRRRVPTSTSDT
jgi:DNA invertase Pin-like site-specific DNA recombinase